MSYVQGFVLAVPAANKQAYRDHACEVAPLFREFGVTRHVEAWGDDVPRGKVNDLWGAVKASEDEAVVFSWFEFPSREARDAAFERMYKDPRMENLGEMPFDGKRMILGGFAPIVEEGDGGAMGYADGFLLAVPEANKQAYRDLAATAAPVFREHGATRVVEAWADDVPDGEVTDFRKAVHATPDETVVFSWIEWPSKEARVAGWEKVMADERMKPDHDNMPFDGMRVAWGGFAPIVDQ